MRKFRIFTTIGASALVIAAIIATKANKRSVNEYFGTLYYGSSKTTVTGIANPSCLNSTVIFTIKSSSNYQSVIRFLNGYAIGYKFGFGYLTLYY